MLHTDPISLYTPSDFHLPMAPLRIGFHAHDADSPLKTEIGQPLDGLLLYGREAAQDVALP
jgi:hypothetical protein